MRQVNLITLNKIKQWEGKGPKAYKDSGGVWTIGYGHTTAAGPPAVRKGMTITEVEAVALLRRDLAQYEATVENSVKVPLTDNQFGALVSFTYNVGSGAFRSSSVLRDLNKGNYNSVPRNLMKWVKVNGRTLPGLVSRRNAEIALWNTGVPITNNNVEPEPQTTSVIDVIKSPEGMMTGGGIFSSLIVAAESAGPLQWALAALIIALIIGGAYFFIKKLKQHDS